MLTEKRIKETEYNVKNYFNQGFLQKTNDFTPRPILIKNTKESLKAARLLSENKIYLWTIVSSYYAMFYIATVALLSLGYKTGDKIVHKVTADALIAILRKKFKSNLLNQYEEIADEALRIAEIKADNIIDSFDFERKKRNTIQYQTSEIDIVAKANTSLRRAQEFVFEMEKLL